MANLGGGGVVGRYDAKPYDGSDGGAKHTYNVASLRHVTSLRSRPVISGGGSSPSIRSTVGPTSRRAPPCRSGVVASSPTIRKGTGFVVWAVCGPSVVGSIISSQLP